MNKVLLKNSGFSFLLVIAGFVLAYQFVEPAPPSELIMATGSPTGAYHRFGLSLQKILAENGVALELHNSAGSMENVSLLADGDVDIALIQGGTPVNDLEGGKEIRSLGSFYYEPLWIFHRIKPPPSRLQQLSGRRVNMGLEGSGTHQLVNELLRLNNMEDEEFSELSNAEASEALITGKLDALFMVSGENSSDIQTLFETKGIALMDLPRAEAYHLHHRYLSVLTLPPGAINLAKERPPEARNLIVVTAILAAHESLHPALVDLLLMSSKRIVEKPTLFSKAGQFPSDRYLSIPLDKDVKRFHQRGPTFLQRYLPYWAATLVDRMVVMLVPLIALVFPLIKVFPPVYRWRVRSRIYRWYADLRQIEARLDKGETDSELEEAIQILENEVKQVETPLSYTDELYLLRSHINLVKARINEQGSTT